MGKPNYTFRGHGYQVYLSKKFYLATIKLQGDLSLSKSHSALLIWTEGLHALKRLNEADYEVNKAKYSVPLDFVPLSPMQSRQEETKENLDRQRNRHYQNVVDQWPKIKDSSKLFLLKTAEKEKHLKWAREVLKLGGPQENEASQ